MPKASEDRFGWTVGAGIEWALWDDWSVKLEYDYYGFGTRSVTFIDNVSGNFGPVDVKQNIQVVKLGLNFHVFAGQPITADSPDLAPVAPEQTTMHVMPSKRRRRRSHQGRRLTIGVAVGDLGNCFRRRGSRGGRRRPPFRSKTFRPRCILRSLPRASADEVFPDIIRYRDSPDNNPSTSRISCRALSSASGRIQYHVQRGACPEPGDDNGSCHEF